MPKASGYVKIDTKARERRDARARVVAELLRLGWTGQQVSAGLKVIDAGGSVNDAIAAMQR